MSDESNDLLGEHALDELGDTMRNQGPPTDRQKVQPRTVDVDDRDVTAEVAERMQEYEAEQRARIRAIRAKPRKG